MGFWRRFYGLQYVVTLCCQIGGTAGSLVIRSHSACCVCIVAIRNGRFWQINQWQINQGSSLPLRIELIGCRLAFKRDYDCDTMLL